VTAGGARRGRRDNGLDAADYAVAGDVDPRVGEHLLDVLAAGGIAAYLQPSADLNPILRTTTYPARPTDRLYVDRTQLEVARGHLHRLTGGAGPTPVPPPAERPGPGGSQSEIDAEWAKIIAGFDAVVDPTAAPWPAAEGVDATRAPDTPADPTAGREDARPAEPPGPLPSAAEFSGISLSRGAEEPPVEAFEDAEEDEEERYTPPPPPPLPRISKYTVAGALGIFVGFVLFLFPDLLPVDRDFVTLIGFGAVVAGAVTLVWRLRSGDEDDDGFDDGAVV
jgi:hypothetical protein